MPVRNQRFLLSFILLLAIWLWPATALANSSWHWITYSPARILAPAIVATLALEMAALYLAAGVRRRGKLALVVALANLASFLLPYLARVAGMVAGGVYADQPFYAAFDRGPYYIVMTGFLVLTLVAEMPIIYFSLRRDCRRPRLLPAVIVAANLVTTLGVALVERQLCQGRW